MTTEAKGWQPIETAPKDDKLYLVFGQPCGEVSGEFGGPIAAVARRWGATWEVGATDYYITTIEASHWLPVPLDPREEKR